MKKIFSIWTIIEGVLLSFGPFYLFKVCSTEEKIMKCYWSSKVQIAFGILGIIIGILMLIAKRRETAIALYIIEITNCILSSSVIKFLIGGCSSKSMRCQSITFPVIYFLNIITIILTAIFLVLCIRSNKE